MFPTQGFSPAGFKFGMDSPGLTRFPKVDFGQVDPQSNPNQTDPYAELNQNIQENATPKQLPSFMDAYRELMQRKPGPASEAYRKFLEQGYPTEGKPTKTTRLAAILSGAAAGFSNPAQGSEVAERILSEPYEKKVRQYMGEGAKLKEAATLEESQHKNDITTVKDMMSEQYRRDELERQNRLADSTIALNAARAKTAGRTVVHADDGHVYIFSPNGDKQDLGKLSETPDEKVQRAIQKTVGEEAGKSPIITRRELTVENQRQANRFGLEGFKYNLWEKKEDTRQGNRIALSQEKANEIAQRLATSVGSKKLDDLRQIKLNLNDAQALVDSDPKYAKFWDFNAGRLKPKQDTTNPDYMTLYSTLYKKTSVSSARTTKAGNERQ